MHRLTRYSLRFLLLLTAVVAVWFAFHFKWIGDRKRAITWMRQQAEFWEDLPVEQVPRFDNEAPVRLRIFGEEGLQRVCVVVPREDEIATKKQELESLFPEADILVVTPGPGYHGKRLEFVERSRASSSAVTEPE